MLTVTRDAYDVVILMNAGLGSNKIAQALSISHSAVLSRQNTLEKLGVISKGTMDGTRRSVLLAQSEFRVEAEHRSTIAARAAADREQAAARDAEAAAIEAQEIAKAERREARRAAREAAKAEAVA